MGWKLKSLLLSILAHCDFSVEKNTPQGKHNLQNIHNGTRIWRIWVSVKRLEGLFKVQHNRVSILPNMQSDAPKNYSRKARGINMSNNALRRNPIKRPQREQQEYQESESVDATAII